MGYETYFQMEMDYNGIVDTAKILEKLNEISMQDWDDLDLEESRKWYDCKEDMVELSKHFPTVLFEIDAEGEENADMWKGRWRNGEEEIIKARIVWDDFKDIRRG